MELAHVIGFALAGLVGAFAGLLTALSAWVASKTRLVNAAIEAAKLVAEEVAEKKAAEVAAEIARRVAAEKAAEVIAQGLRINGTIVDVRPFELVLESVKGREIVAPIPTRTLITLNGQRIASLDLLQSGDKVTLDTIPPTQITATR